MTEQQPLSSDPQAGLSSVAPPPLSTDELLRQAHEAAAKGDMEGANAAFFQIPADERKQRGLYAGPGGADPAASGNAALALGGASAMTSVGRAIMGGSTLGGKAVAGAKAAVTQLTPIVKYEATKTLLESVGVPSPLAATAATFVSGYQRGGKAAGAAAPAEVAASGALSATEEAQLLKQGYPPSVIAKVRAGALKQSAQRSASGPTPSAAAPAIQPAVPAPAPPAAVAEMPPPAPGQSAPPPTPPRPAGAASKPSLLAAEGKEYMRLIKAGKSHKEAMELIEAQRALVQRLGLPSAEAARRAVVDRNTDGRWPE